MATEGCVSSRTILWWLVFTGTAMNYITRMSINIAIVSMVKSQAAKHDNVSLTSECFNASIAHPTLNNRDATGNATGPLDADDENRVSWDEYEQGLVLGSPYWLYWATQLPSSMVAHRYGSKIVFGLSNYIMCMLGILIPFATFNNFYLLIAIRVLQGFVGGFVWPVLHAITAAWVPPNERSKFITAYTGSSLGSAITFPLCGQLIHWFGWQSVFYTTGVLGTVWFIAWWLLMFDSPEKHPRISTTERDYILAEIGKTKSNEKIPTPWIKMLKSVPVWLVNFTQWGNLWCLYTIFTQAPTYLYYIHGWDIQMTGILSGIPHIMRVVFAFVMSIVCDYLLRTNKMSRTSVRKLAIAVCLIEERFIFALSVVKSPRSVMSEGGVLRKWNSSHMSETRSSNLSHGVSLFQQTPSAWQMVFLVSALMVLVPEIFHLIFGTSEVQEWNYPVKSATQLEEIAKEKEKLNPNFEESDKNNTK
uniref:Major facilitator superfamily (MFS) profile domain-containing protein n=1 Tax=Timema cristinae TaxID=61476 RepID=A0A7R9CU98_TIMCR|nr:unnamed protein product [Timema cristinae]